MSGERHLSPAELRALVRERDGDDCSICGAPIDFTAPAGTFMGASLEHVIPRAAGGRTELANLRLAHAYPCNHAKAGVHDGVDYAAARDSAQGIRPATERYSRRVASAVAQASRTAARLGSPPSCS